MNLVKLKRFKPTGYRCAFCGKYVSDPSLVCVPVKVNDA